MNNCIFCKIIKGEIPSYKIYEDEKTYAFLDISKDAYGHTLVIPKEHHDNIFNTPNSTLNNLIETTKLIASHYKNLGYTGVNIINNSGTSSGQTVMHIHFHIFPRENSDNLNLYNNLSTQNLDLKLIQEKLIIKSWH